VDQPDCQSEEDIISRLKIFYRLRFVPNGKESLGM